MIRELPLPVAVVVALAVLLVVSQPVEAQLFGRPDKNDRFGQRLATGDFDGDGYDDLAIGVPQERNEGYSLIYGGQVQVIYGSADGLRPRRQQLWNLLTMGVDPFDQTSLVGHSLSSGDFNNDGYADLAIGAPEFLQTPRGTSGAVNVLYGSEDGLTNRQLQTWNEYRLDLDGIPLPFDYFGWDVCAGDYDGDGFDDLAIGILDREIDGIAGAGQILILYGSNSGPDVEGHQYVNQPPGKLGFEPGVDNWGRVLASGDINGDGFDELVVGMPFKSTDTEANVGAAGVMFGGPNGIRALGYDLLVQDEAAIIGGSDPEDGMGGSLLVADFGTDGFEDLIVGIPWENIGDDATTAEGALLFFHGSENGVSREGHAMWWSDAAVLGSGTDAGDLFSFSLAAGDFDGDGDNDLAIGEPGDHHAGGGFIVTPSMNGGIASVFPTFWTNASDGIGGSPSGTAQLGYALATGDFNGDGFDDLAATALGDGFETGNEAGAVNVLYGSEDGITADRSQYLHQNLLPTEPEIVSPADGASVDVGSTGNPADPDTPLIIVWSPAEDPENVPIEYWWQVSSNADFSDTLATVRVGFVNQFATTLGFLGDLLRDKGVAYDETVTWYHRIIADDYADYVTGPAVALKLTRGTLVSNEADEQPGRAVLFGSYPNPFATSTTIHFRTDAPGDVSLEVYDVRGRLVRSQVLSNTAPGEHSFGLERGEMPAGVYVYRMAGGGLSVTGRVVLIP
ncbi:MAG: T9SS type A sorting domain-containing protein [Rhodothermales bacterium]